jgi:uncharacterized protein (DUF2461 family)
VSFTGFDPAAVALLDRLPDMTADEYAARKAELTAGVTRPGAALIAAVADRLDADLTVVPRSSVSPLHRDLRFAPQGAARYKDHLLLTTWEGVDKKTSPMFWIRIDAERVGFASGIGFTPAMRERWRAAIGGDAGAALAGELDELVREHAAEVAGDRVKRVPAPFDADHPRADLLRHTGFQVRSVDEMPDSVGTAEFADWCADRLAALLPVHRWLIAHLTTRPDRPA